MEQLFWSHSLNSSRAQNGVVSELERTEMRYINATSLIAITCTSVAKF